MYVQEFYNGESNPSDFVQSNVYNVLAMFQVVAVEYGTLSDPFTRIKFVQTTQWDSHDGTIDVMAVVNQPFITEDYRNAYVAHLQKYLPGNFQMVTEEPSVATDNAATTSDYNLSDTFFCAEKWPVDCSNTKPCKLAGDCDAGHGCFVATECLHVPTAETEPAPVVATESSAACNLCKPGQIGIDAPIIFNSNPSSCMEAYDHMAINYVEGDPTCVAAQDALSSTCCKDAPSDDPVAASESIADADSMTVTVTETETTTTTTTETMAQSVELDLPELLYPSDSYYCGTSFQDASTTCGKPCPSGMDNECLGAGETCHGNTECGLRASFFCGSSWFDASDKCSQPCPDGDAGVCGEGEKCFAWTSCANTQSYYCGYSFENASKECKIPCESRSSNDCPEDMACWAYTTCDATKEGAHEEGPVPLNDYFCGDTPESAAGSCSIACQSGSDDECPGELKCFGTTECSKREHFWCGPNWFEAASTCGKPCPSGDSGECGEGSSCYAHTKCQSDLFFCGDSFEDASNTCGKPCPSRSSNECDNGQSCYAFVTECADSPAAQSMTDSYTSMAANNAWGIDKDSFAKDDSDEDPFKGQQPPDWYVSWEADQMKSSSNKAGTWIAFAGLTLAGFSALLAL